MTEAYDVWLVLGSAGVLLTIASLIGSALMAEIPYKAMVVAAFTGFCLFRAFAIAEEPLNWASPLEASVRLYAEVF